MEDIPGSLYPFCLCACAGQGLLVMLWFLMCSWDTKPGGGLQRDVLSASQLSSKKKLHIRAQAAGTSRDKILSAETRPSIRINVADAMIYGTTMKV